MSFFSAYADLGTHIIGSGELFENGRARIRAQGIQEIPQSESYQVLYAAADRKTKIWAVRR